MAKRLYAAETTEETCGKAMPEMAPDFDYGCGLVKGHPGKCDQRIDTFGYDWTEAWLHDPAPEVPG